MIKFALNWHSATLCTAVTGGAFYWEPGRAVRRRAHRILVREECNLIEGLTQPKGLDPSSEGPVTLQKSPTRQEKGPLMPPKCPRYHQKALKHPDGLIAGTGGGGADPDKSWKCFGFRIFSRAIDHADSKYGV